MPAMTYDEYLQLARTLSRDEFAGRFGHPFLVCDRAPRDTEVGFSTQLMDLKSLRVDEEGGDKPGHAPAPRGVYAVVKTARDPEPGKISIGRAGTNDVVLTTRKVSKLHAHLVPSGGRWSLVDARSMNGTFVAGRKLGESEIASVRPGDEVRFGLLEMRFLDGAQLFDWLLT